MTRAHYIRMGAVSGLSAKETILAPPGELFDIFELYLQANGGYERKEID